MGIGQILKLSDISQYSQTVKLFTKMDIDSPYLVLKMDTKRWIELGRPDHIAVGINSEGRGEVESPNT